MNDVMTHPPRPLGLWMAGALGLAWNGYGILQFWAMAQGTVGNLMREGLTLEQAQLYASLPWWMHGAFAVGTLGGAIGCLLLLAARRQARGFFALSLVAYAVLYVGDIVLGVFSVFGWSQVAILTLVLAVAAALWWLSGRPGHAPAW